MGTQNAEVGRDFEKPTLQLKKKKKSSLKSRNSNSKQYMIKGAGWRFGY